MDQQEAHAVANRFLEGKPLVELYDSVLIPALALVEQDRHQGVLDDVRCNFFFLSIGELVAELTDYHQKEIPADSALRAFPASPCKKTSPSSASPPAIRPTNSPPTCSSSSWSRPPTRPSTFPRLRLQRDPRLARQRTQHRHLHLSPAALRLLPGPRHLPACPLTPSPQPHRHRPLEPHRRPRPDPRPHHRALRQRQTHRHRQHPRPGPPAGHTLAPAARQKSSPCACSAQRKRTRRSFAQSLSTFSDVSSPVRRNFSGIQTERGAALPDLLIL